VDVTHDAASSSFSLKERARMKGCTPRARVFHLYFLSHLVISFVSSVLSCSCRPSWVPPALAPETLVNVRLIF
jgi:hypothetical protein